MALEDLLVREYSYDIEEKMSNRFIKEEECVLKKCCEKYRKKNKYCKKCPKK